MDRFRRYEIKNEKIKAVFIPELGGKMVHLERLEKRHQYLLESQFPKGEYYAPEYGDDFEKFDTSGFDECFPTVSSASIEIDTGAKTVRYNFPDHGELWSRSWEVEQLDTTKLKLSIEGVKADYRFEKVISLEDESLHIHYRLINRENHKLPFIWSAHPLLAVSAGSQIITEPLNTLLINWASDKMIGEFGDRIPWPEVNMNGQSKRLDLVPNKSFGKTAKLFSGPLQRGGAALYRADWDESVVFNFDTDKTPYLGLWLCYGGWPVDSERPHFTVGIEPATGRPDSLEEAMKRGEYMVVEAQSEFEWPLTITLQQGKFEPQKHENLVRARS